MPPNPPQQVRTTHGPAANVPCPHCGKPNDFAPQVDLQTCEKGQVFDCDHCDRPMEVHQVTPIVIVHLKQFVPKQKQR